MPRPITITKRLAGRPIGPDHPQYADAHWHVRLYQGGKETTRSLQTPNKAEATRRAKALRQAVRDQRWSALLQPVTAKSATIRQLVEAYRVAPLELQSQESNINCFRQLVLAAGLHGDQPTTALGPKLITAYIAKITQDTQHLDQTAAARRRRSANSIINQALSLFTPAALAAYQDAGLHIPVDTLSSLRDTYKARRFRKVTKDSYNPPTDTTLSATLDTWRTHPDRNLYLAVGLMLAFGLRKAEVTAARWDWITLREGVPYLDASTRVKSGTGRLTVRPIDPHFRDLMTRAHAEGWIQPGETILQGSPTETSEGTFKRISAWLTQCGWETSKKSHALRAYAGSLVAMRWGIYQAQHWLRHASVSVTESHYAHFVKAFDQGDPETSPTQWAQPWTPGQWEPKLLEA